LAGAQVNLACWRFNISLNRNGQLKLIARGVQARVIEQFNALFFAVRKLIVQISSF
jgi:hypothetical protein